jgi:hypothetical protein
MLASSGYCTPRGTVMSSKQVCGYDYEGKTEELGVRLLQRTANLTLFHNGRIACSNEYNCIGIFYISRDTNKISANLQAE